MSPVYTHDMDVEGFVKASRVCNVEDMTDHLNAYTQHGQAAAMSSVLLDIMVNPEKFLHPKQTLAVLEDRRIGFDGAFEDMAKIGANGDATDEFLWTAYAQSPTPDTAATIAVILAEYLRYRFLKDEKYRPDFLITLEVDEVPPELKEIMFKASLRDSIIATQNALVDYVRENAEKLPIQRGAPMLKLLAQDLPKSVGRLWTEKMSDIKIGSRYDIKLGEIPAAQITYAPS